MAEFKEKCYEVLKKVPYGKVITYKDIARRINSKAYRAVGKAFKENHNKKILCYKVIKSNGDVGEYNLGKLEKIRLLKKEGIEIKNGRIDLKKYGWEIKKAKDLNMHIN